MKVSARTGDRIHEFLYRWFPDWALYTPEERNVIEAAREVFYSGQARKYGHWNRIDLVARASFGFCGLAALIAQLAVLWFRR